MYVRFVTPSKDENSHSRQGILVTAHELRDQGNLEPHEHELLCATLAWFNMHLRIPGVLKDAENTRAISWFKSEAHSPIEKVWDLVAILRTHGVIVELLKTEKPGTVIYEDKWQIVAKPSRGERTRGRW